MKKYSFKLESLLKVRKLQEEEAERVFREAMIEYEMQLQILEELKEEFQRTLEDLANQRQRGFDARIQDLYNVYFKHLKQKTDAQTKVVYKAEEYMEEKRLELIEAMKEEKVVEKMKLRDYEKYSEELKRWEQAIIDDLTILRHNSEMASGRSVNPTQ